MAREEKEGSWLIIGGAGLSDQEEGSTDIYLQTDV